MRAGLSLPQQSRPVDDQVKLGFLVDLGIVARQRRLPSGLTVYAPAVRFGDGGIGNSLRGASYWRNAMGSPSADQNGLAASSVPARAREAGSLRTRIHSWVRPAAEATKAIQPPSGERIGACGVKSTPSGAGMENRRTRLESGEDAGDRRANHARPRRETAHKAHGR